MDAPKGQKLFNTRKACEARISTVIKSWRRQFKFKCFACQSYFDGAQQLSSHDIRWCQMLHGSTNQEHTTHPSKVRTSCVICGPYAVGTLYPSVYIRVYIY